MGTAIAGWLVSEGILAASLEGAVAVGINAIGAAAVSLGVSAALGGGRKGPGELLSGTHLTTRRSRNSIKPLVYGTCRLGVNQVFLVSSGDDNKYLHIIGNLGEGPMHGIKNAAASGDTTSSASPNADVFLDERHFSDYGANVYWEFFRGTATQNVCSTLNSAYPSWTDPKRYCAYIYLRLEWDEEKFNVLPHLTVTVEGLELYDPYADTTGFSANPALCAYDMLTRPATRGGLGLDTWHGPVPATPRIDVDTVEDLRSYCATKGWTCNMPIVDDRAFVDNFGQIQANCRGGIIRSLTKFYFTFRDTTYESVVMSLDEDDLISGTLRMSAPSAAGTRPNAIRMKYLSEQAAATGAGSYQVREYVYSDADAITADGDYREESVQALGLSDIESVQKMAYYFLERMRNAKTVDFVAKSRCLSLEPEDLIQLTYEPFGWTSQLLRVLAAGDNGDGTVTLSCGWEATSLYDDNYQSSSPQWYATSLPDALAAVPSVINVSQAEEVYYHRQRSFTRWKIDFDRPAAADYPFWSHAEIWVKYPGESEYRFRTISTTDHVLDPVQEGATYSVKIRSVAVTGAKESLTTCQVIGRTIVGKTTAPTSLSALTAIPAGDSITLVADPITDPDIAGYEVRLGDSWAGGVFLAFMLDSKMQLTNMRPGTYTFFMAPKGNNGEYADTPKSATAVLNLPPGFTLANSWTWDYDGIGTHSNTEHTTHSSTDALKCSHTGGVLAGTWTSPEYDLGSVKTVRIFGDFLTAFESPAGTFSSVWGTTNDFEDVDPSGDKTFSELYALTEAGQLEATIKYGNTSGSLTSELDFFHISAPEIEARYVQLEITITDPAADSNLYLYELNMKAYTWS